MKLVISRIMSGRQKYVLLLFAIGIAPALFGGTVITDNLPANTAIINISGIQDGASGYNGDQSLLFHPFSVSGAAGLLEYTVPAGTYAFRIVNPADAASLFPALTAAQTNQIYTAWTFNSPWATDYLVFDSAAATNFSLPQLFDGAYTNVSNHGPFYPDASSAYNAALANGSYDQIRTGALGRNGTVFTNSYTFASAETLIFIVPDYALSDNSGGVSVLVSPAGTANPALTILPGAGLVTLLWPTNASGYGLEESTALPASRWETVTNIPVAVATSYAVTLSVDSTNHFFRLKHQ